MGEGQLYLKKEGSTTSIFKEKTKENSVLGREKELLDFFLSLGKVLGFSKDPLFLSTLTHSSQGP